MNEIGFWAMKLGGKVAVVTGGSRGMGACIASRFGVEGARVAVISKNNIDKAQSVADQIEASGGIAQVFSADVSDTASCISLVRKVHSVFNTIDILVNNAGIYMPLSIEDTTEQDWDNQLNTNLKGCFFMIKAVLPIMKENKRGKIINISSSFGLVGAANASAYCASKGGLMNLTRALCIELAPYNINVNTLAPGGAKTDMNLEQRQIPGFKTKVDRLTPSGSYFMEPDDLSGAAVFLASGDSDSVHGAHITVDGGWTAG